MALPEITVHCERGAGVSPQMIASDLRRMLGASARAGEPLGLESWDLGSCAITDPLRPLPAQPRGARRASARLYDGARLLAIAADAVGYDTLRSGELHIIVVPLAVCTYDARDARYHARPVIASSPSLLSPESAVMGPALSVADMVAIMERRTRRAPDPAVTPYLRAGDARMQRAMAVYAAQAASFIATGEAFCADRACMLYNAHYQPELLRQIGSPQLCARHRRELAGLT